MRNSEWGAVRAMVIINVPSGDHDGSNNCSASSASTLDVPPASGIVRRRRTPPPDVTIAVDPRSHPTSVCAGGSVNVARLVPSAFETTQRRAAAGAPASRYISVVPSGESPGVRPRAVATSVT